MVELSRSFPSTEELVDIILELSKRAWEDTQGYRLKMLHGERLVFQPDETTVFRLSTFNLLRWLRTRYDRNVSSPLPFVVFGLIRQARHEVCRYYRIFISLFERDMENRRKYLSALLRRNIARYPERLPPSVSAKWFEEAES